MPEPVSLPELSRRRLLLTGLAAIPAATVLAARLPSRHRSRRQHPGTAPGLAGRRQRGGRQPRLLLLTSPYRSQEKEKSCS